MVTKKEVMELFYLPDEDEESESDEGERPENR